MIRKEDGMGECLDEAIQNGLDEIDREYKMYGCIDHNSPKYNEDLWRDCFGVVRKIRDMDSMHLKFTIDYIKSLDSYKKMRRRVKRMEFELERRGFTEEEYEFHKMGCDLGLYCMYDREDDNRIRWH